jgi:hypothetical protein
LRHEYHGAAAHGPAPDVVEKVVGAELVLLSV